MKGDRTMDNVYVKKEHLNRWIAKYFPSKDLISVDDLLSAIEDLDSEVASLKGKIQELEEPEEEDIEKY